MSASTEKKLRQTSREAGTDKKAIAAQEAAKKQAKSKRNTAIICGIIALFVIFAIVVNSTLLYTSSTALKLGDNKYSPADVSYNYASQYSQFLNYYGSMASYLGLDTNYGISGLRDQMFGEDMTWRDYFIDAAVETMKETKAYADYATANGLTLSAEDLENINSSIADIDNIAALYSYPSANKFLAANYGKGVTTKTILNAYKEMYLADKGQAALLETFTYSDAELDEHYASFEGERDIYSYAYYYIPAVKVETTDADGNTTTAATDETIADAVKNANDIASTYGQMSGDAYMDNFNTAVSIYSGGTDTATPSGSIQGSGVNSAFADWAKDSARKAGDITVAENTGGAYVVLWLDHSDNSYNVAQVRHILIKAEADENGEYTEEALAAAKQQAEEVLAQWKSGEATEESFAALANELSEDAGSNTNGGLYDTVAKGQMVEEFDAFCFGGHKAGDTAVVYGSSNSYAGYHVMYYVGQGNLYSRVIAEEDLKNTAVSEWITAAVDSISETRTWSLNKLVG